MADISRLPGPSAELWDWQLKGNCRAVDPALFFHPEGERGPRRAARERAAKAICERCPVRQPCGEAALAAHEPYGVWGGLSESEREEIISARRRQHRVAS